MDKSSYIYFDNHLQTKPSNEVLKAMQEAQEKFWASAAAPYQIGDLALTFVNEKSKDIFELIDATEEDSLIFCSSGIDAIEKVLLNFLIDRVNEEKPLHIVSIENESSFISFYLDNLAKKPSVKVSKIPLDNLGKIDLKAFEKVISVGSVNLVTLSFANGLTGVIQPIEEMSKICKEYNDKNSEESKRVTLHVDSSYVMGKVYFSYKNLPVDYLTFSSELIHGPKTGAALFIKSHRKIDPWISGGEKDAFLAHKIDVVSFAGFAKSCQEAKEALDQFSFETAFLANMFEESLKEKIKHISFPLKKADRLPNVSVVVFENIPSEPFLFYLNEEKLCATFGRGFSIHLAKALQLSGYEKKNKNSWSALSFSLSRNTTQEEIELAVDAIVRTYEKVKRNFSIS